MACPSIVTGDRFLTRTLEHIDCQAQLLGSYGYQALGQPGSLASTVVLGLLTLFIALIGVRFLFGPGPGARDLVYDALKVGIVLTLAFSWPAFRTVVYDVAIAGPAEITSGIATPGTGDTSVGFVARLQAADSGIVELTESGVGRNTGALLGESPGASFVGTALQDDAALGWARLLYLAGTIGSVGLLRLIAGLLLALAPIAAGMLLFEATRGLFAGWLRGLVLSMLGAVGVSVVLAVELAVLEPWLADALLVRGLGYGVRSAPIELLAITLAFALIQAGAIWLLAKVAFMRGWPSMQMAESQLPVALWQRQQAAPSAAKPIHVESRAQRTADSIERLGERQTRSVQERMSYRTLVTGGVGGGFAVAAGAGGERMGSETKLGSSYRRTAHRGSIAARRREGRS
ncbi:type IV secretion system protein [Pelagerythrobacter sp.]|uniref:type IV secretion system protein n=1 Tax=Pelagerythrobacter sp. TaxID=2800702 RepID=UPI0035B284D9